MHETPNPKPLEGASAPKICPKCQDLIDRRVCGMCAECWYGAQPKRDAQAPAATPGEVEATICYGCGTCGKEKIEPPAISCCPERKIVTVQEAAQRAANDSLKVRDMVATWIFDALAALPESPAPQGLDPRETEWAFRDGFYAGAKYMGWRDSDAAGCDAQIGEANTKSWEARCARLRSTPQQAAPAESGTGDILDDMAKALAFVSAGLPAPSSLPQQAVKGEP